MNTRLLKAFLMLAEKGNYADAARALFISQPALTKQINLLESQVNMSLFTRGRHGAMLTASVTHIAPPELAIIPLAGESISWKVGIAWDASREDVIRDNFIASVAAAFPGQPCSVAMPRAPDHTDA